MTNFWFVLAAFWLLSVGISGLVFSRRNFVTMLMAIEVMLLASNLLLAFFSTVQGSLEGQVFVLFSLTVTAAEAAIGLAIFVVYFRRRASIGSDCASSMKG